MKREAYSEDYKTVRICYPPEWYFACPSCGEKKIYSCGDCAELKICKIRKNLVKGYLSKYKLDLDLNATKLTDLGSSQWLTNQVLHYKCSECNGVISPYDNKCIHCQK